MKNVINYFYNLNIDNIRMIDDNYYFVYQNKNFVFQQIKDNYLDYNALFELNKFLLGKNKSIYQIILNKNNEVVTNTSNKKYIMLVDNYLYDSEFDFIDVLDTNVTVNNSKIANNLSRFNWNVLWKNKIDHFEFFINHNINKYKKLNQYYNYFIGLAENAISYINDTLDEEKTNLNDKLVVSHKRIKDNSSFKQLYNPVMLVIDHPSRDLSEYLKFMFLNDKVDFNRVEEYLEEANLSTFGARLLIGRMLFPSFFFDKFEGLLEEKDNIKSIMNIIDKMNDYEIYVLKIFNIIKQKYFIPEISWLKKVDYSSTLTTPNTSGTSLTNIDSIPSFSVTSIILQ